MNDVRTLCSRCKQDYRAAGYTVTMNGWQDIKDNCDICSRLGLEYVVKEPEKKVKNGCD
jgi:hypothetical protein